MEQGETNMVTREFIHSEIDRLSMEQLEELHKLIRQLSRPKPKVKKKGALARIKKIKISAPSDFAANHDHYASGAEQRD
jgi:hypothetical protein